MGDLTIKTTAATAALLTLDAEGGWDHDPGWESHIRKSIQVGVSLDLVEHCVSFDVCHWRLTDDGIELRRKLDLHATKIPASGDPERDAGWLVSTPWLGQGMAVFGRTKEGALAQAERGRAAHVAELQALVDRWSSYQLEAEFVETDNDE